MQLSHFFVQPGWAFYTSKSGVPGEDGKDGQPGVQGRPSDKGIPVQYVSKDFLIQ